jgi:Fe-S-cluster containining protein
MIGRQDFFARVRGKSHGYTTEQLYAAYETYLTCPLSPFRERRETVNIDCSRCGNCCRKPWRVEVHLWDVLRWAVEGRHDILASLERRPLGRDPEHGSCSPLIRQLAALMAGTSEDRLVKALTVVKRVEASEGSYVLPKNGGCSYLIDGPVTVCSIYDTRPEVCRRFPDIR